MENIIFALNALAPLYLTIGLGYLLKQKRVIDQHFIDTSSDFAFGYLFPFVIFRQIYQTDIAANINPLFIGYGVFICVLLGTLLSLIVPHFIKDRQTCSAYIHGSYRSNCVLMGVALSISVFGETGAIPTITLLPFASIVFNIIAVIILTAMSPDNLKVSVKGIIFGVIKNPIIIGAVAGVIVSVLDIQFPIFLSAVIDDLAAMVTPLALIGLGGQLEVKSLFAQPKLILSASFMKLILSPMIAIVPAVIFFDFNSYEIGALYFIFGSSTAVSSFVMSKAMKSNDKLAGQLIMFTTIFSSVIMFAWIFLLKTIQVI